DLIATLFPERGGSLLGDKASSVVFDNGKIKRFVPGFAARIPFAEGMLRSVAWYDADPARRVVSDKANEMLDRVIAAQRPRSSSCARARRWRTGGRWGWWWRAGRTRSRAGPPARSSRPAVPPRCRPPSGRRA